MGKGRILVVEDDIDISKMLRIYFDSQGYEVLVANRGNDALDTCRTKLPNVVVLDIQLPDIDGYEVCRTLRNNTRTSYVPIIFLTQKDERSDKIAGLELGADDYITKPFDIEELKLRVEGAIRRSQREALTHPVTNLPAGKLIEEHFDLRPGAIIRDLDLRRPIYRPTAVYGHFGRDDIEAPWENTDRADALRRAAGL